MSNDGQDDPVLNSACSQHSFETSLMNEVSIIDNGSSLMVCVIFFDRIQPSSEPNQ